MDQKNAIKLTKVSNGFVIELPDKTPSEMATITGKLMGDVLQKVLSQINDETPGPVEMPQVDELVKEQSSVHIFKTFEEVCEFLEYHFKE